MAENKNKQNEELQEEQLNEVNGGDIWRFGREYDKYKSEGRYIRR